MFYDSQPDHLNALACQHNPAPIEQRSMRILLIDLENCPNHIQELQDSLRDYDKVIICYASTAAKIPLDWLMPLHETINAGHLQIHKMDRIGKNAADFGIFFFAGMLAQQLSAHAEFTLISDDTDLDHLVNLLSGLGHAATRKGKEKVIAPPKPEPTPTAQAAEPASQNQTEIAAGLHRYCNHLHLNARLRPTSEQALHNSIHALLGQKNALTQAVYKQLLKLGAVTVNGSKVAYQATKISQLAQMQV